MEKLLDSEYYGKGKISSILLKVAPPVMIIYLIQALYNIVDSFYLGKVASEALNALAVIFPLQNVIVALATGTGVGVNTLMAKYYAQGRKEDADSTSGVGFLLALISWVIFTILSLLIIKPYCNFFVKSELGKDYAITYGTICCIGSLGTFLSGVFSNVLEAKGDMICPMISQVVGAIINIVLDYCFIFGWWIFPKMGIAGAALATVIGQVIAAIIVGIKALNIPKLSKKIFGYIRRIYFYGYSSIAQQVLYTVYILILNAILTKFCDEAITVLGLYYKYQAFFFIPLFGFMTCIIPVLSFNYTRKSYDRCRETIKISFIISMSFMVLGMIFFIFFPEFLLNLFSADNIVMNIGKVAFPIIGFSFISATFSLMMPVVFQAIGNGKVSTFLSSLRQLICLVFFFWVFSLIGLNYTWIAFPVSETLAGGTGLILYCLESKKWRDDEKK